MRTDQDHGGDHDHRVLKRADRTQTPHDPSEHGVGRLHLEEVALLRAPWSRSERHDELLLPDRFGGYVIGLKCSDVIPGKMGTDEVHEVELGSTARS